MINQTKKLIFAKLYKELDEVQNCEDNRKLKGKC